MISQATVKIINTDGEVVEFSKGCRKSFMFPIYINTMFDIESILGRKVGDYDLIIADFSDTSKPEDILSVEEYQKFMEKRGLGVKYSFFQECDCEETATQIKEKCNAMIDKQYNRMKLIKAGEEYDLEVERLRVLKEEFNNPKNRELDLSEYINKDKGSKTIVTQTTPEGEEIETHVFDSYHEGHAGYLHNNGEIIPVVLGKVRGSKYPLYVINGGGRHFKLTHQQMGLFFKSTK